MKINKTGQFGGAAIEYILVSTFATLLTFASIAFIGKLTEEKLRTIADETGIEIDLDFLELFKFQK